jgi:hypothetical protein
MVRSPPSCTMKPFEKTRPEARLGLIQYLGMGGIQHPSRAPGDPHVAIIAQRTFRISIKTILSKLCQSLNRKRTQHRCGATMTFGSPSSAGVRRDAFSRSALTRQRFCKQFLHDVSIETLSSVRTWTSKASLDSRGIAGAFSNKWLVRRRGGFRPPEQ